MGHLDAIVTVTHVDGASQIGADVVVNDRVVRGVDADDGNAVPPIAGDHVCLAISDPADCVGGCIFNTHSLPVVGQRQNPRAVGPDKHAHHAVMGGILGENIYSRPIIARNHGMVAGAT